MGAIYRRVPVRLQLLLFGLLLVAASCNHPSNF